MRTNCALATRYGTPQVREDTNGAPEELPLIGPRGGMLGLLREVGPGERVPKIPWPSCDLRGIARGRLLGAGML